MKAEARRALITAKVAYENAEKSRVATRAQLRKIVRRAQAEGITVVAIADALGWSRQSVYQLLDDS